MKEDTFSRYIWLIDIIRKSKNGLTYKEIHKKWKESGFKSGEMTSGLSKATFRKYRHEISNIFNIKIECNTKNKYRYEITQPKDLEKDVLKSWLIDAYAMMFQIDADGKRENRIIFENIPTGHPYLTFIAKGISDHKVINIAYRDIGCKRPTSFDIEPYYLKTYHKIWHVIARSPYYSQVEGKDVFLTYALDRIEDVHDTGKVFEPNKDFDIDKFFKGCCGLQTSDAKINKIEIKVYGDVVSRLRAVPIHESQKEIELDDDFSIFELRVKPTCDFYHKVLTYGPYVEVLSPISVRKKLHKLISEMLLRYK